MDSSIVAQANALLSRLALQCSTSQGFGSISTSIYDTAWVSMVPDPRVESAWLFPESFEYLLATQLPDGGWPSYATTLDGILNTAAALLSLRRHLRSATPAHPDWVSRSSIAEKALCAMLDDWDVLANDQVGFELLVFQHIKMLREDGADIRFANIGTLAALYDEKIAKIPPFSVHKAPSTLLHSLEALIGHIDFDQVGQWRESNGSMMGSPSSTAAYLIHASTWDNEAEDYLRRVLSQGSGNGNGSVPSAWPTTVFEVTWVVATFAAVGISVDVPESTAISNFVQGLLASPNGTVGFSPSALPDADDTAMAIATLQYLGKAPDLGPFIDTFEADNHFRTYDAERNPSISANCNALICLLSRDDRCNYVPKIVKALRFICNQVIAGNVREKWANGNELLHQQLLEHAPELRSDIIQVSLHVLLSILQRQRPDGSWEGVCEVTAYATLSLKSLSSLPWTSQMRCAQLALSMEHGKSFLLAKRDQWCHGDYLWTEKVTYGCGILSEAYCLSAAAVSPISEKDSQLSYQWAHLPAGVAQKVKGARKLIQRTPLFQGTSPYLLDIAELQACYSIETLERGKHQVFPRTGLGEDKYLAFIPLTWTACSVLQRHRPLSISTLRTMMSLSMLNYQVDEYMETIVADNTSLELDNVRLLVDGLFEGEDGHRPKNRDISDGDDDTHMADEDSVSLRKVENGIAKTLRRYVAWVLQNPSVVASGAGNQNKLRYELRAFLLAHITQGEDNRRIASWKQHRSCDGERRSPSTDIDSGYSDDGAVDSSHAATAAAMPGRSFYNWVRTTSADHTSCPFSLVFFVCLVVAGHAGGAGGNDVFAAPKTAYVLEDLCRHLASLCRMYNDYGSIARDRAEGNMNSVDFPEFRLSSSPSSLDRAKQELMWIAEYERRGLDGAVAELEKMAAALGGGSDGRTVVEALAVFRDVTDLYGQIYVIRDIATRVR
ncbi:uncharacterized protein PG998_005675 [Apiospora kogelbergensis]|uniref:uncharacterized protein n=1 Tax=Apiospora kogelbergensis TaxID=1337665 RepID=UPI00312ECF30